ncbi:MAG: STAS domain-containing protein [Pseudomonadota bacterium]
MQVQEGVASLSGDLVLDRATDVLAEAEAALAGGARVFDLAGVDSMDSSALSLLLSLRRRAGGQPLEFRNLPESLTSLAKLYGIADQL